MKTTHIIFGVLLIAILAAVTIFRPSDDGVSRELYRNVQEKNIDLKRPLMRPFFICGGNTDYDNVENVVAITNNELNVST